MNGLAPHTTHIKVRGYHLDLYHHVNNARYLEFLEEARWTFFEDRGDLPWFLASGLALVVANININYRSPASMGDELAITTSLGTLGQRSATIQQKINLVGNGRLIAEADITFVVFDSRQNKAVQLEGELHTRFKQLQ